MYSLLVNLVSAVLALGAILYLFFKYQHGYWKRKGVPSLPGHWFFGNGKDMALLRESPGMVIAELYNKAPENADVLGIYICHKPFLVLKNPDVIKQIFVKDFHAFPDRYFTAKSLRDKVGSTGLFTIANPAWKYLRGKLSPVFSSGKLKKTFYLLSETAESMHKYLEEELSAGSKSKVMDVKDVATKYTTDVISSVAFGVQVNSFNPATREFFNKIQAGLRLTIRRAFQFFIMFFFPTFSPLVAGQLLGTSTNYFRKVFWDSMDSRELSKTKRGDLIDFLVELKNATQDNDFKFEGDALLAQSAIFFVAGRESSVTTISYTLYELAKRPDIQEKLRIEIRDTLETQSLTYDSLLSMKYLQQVVSEVLRLYPAAPLLDRVAKEDYKIPGTDIVIEKGTPVYVALFGLHRDPKYFPDPLSFDPDRFSDENKHNIKPFTYMPFGEGPRNCIGMRLGLMQSSVALVTILKDYAISLDQTYKYDIERRNVFLVPPDGFRLKLTKL